MLGWFFRQFYLLQRVKIKVWFRSYIRDVRTVETRRNEKGSLLVFFKQPNCLLSHFSVGLFRVSSFGFHPGQCCSQLPIWREVDYIGLGLLISSLRVHHLVPRRRIIQSAGPNVTRHPIMENLPNPSGKVAVILEKLRQSHHFWHCLSHPDAIVVNSRGIRS